ncbi:MAG TPA: GDP-mannose 4,6-dehydratase [Burkholderiales bacterium]|nr:GDP-mannose 4,6-dehydratase [Burkholderiales bacterium]
MASRTALITGITGQDGSYLAELLVERGYGIVGVVRRDPGEARRSLPAGLAGRVELVGWDMRDASGIAQILREYRPGEFYNCAGYSSGAGMYDEPVAIGEVNGLAVARILEAIREVDAGIRFCQASSSEIFANAVESPQSEATPVSPRSPYGAAKAYADFMVRIYRERHGLFACSAILFNHESPRRSTAFVTRKITHELARIKRGLASEIALGNLSARRDWGFAGDYVRAMWSMLQQSRAEEFIVSTGETHSVREFCELAFARLGMDYRRYVKEDAHAYRAAETIQLVGNSAKAHRVLGWRPEKGFEDLVKMMVDADLQGALG